MENIEKELEELFFADAMNKCDKVNDLFQNLKKDNTDNTKTIGTLVFCLKKLKTNAEEMHYPEIASVSGSLEEVFGNFDKEKNSISEHYYQKLIDAKKKLSQVIQQSFRQSGFPKISFQTIAPHSLQNRMS